MRLLLVEDDNMIGEAVSGSLKDARYTVDWVRDGKTALTSLSAQAYDVVLLDLGLPQKDGLQVLSEIRSGGLDVPVLILTARDDLDSRLKGLDSGADDYIIKPFDMSEVLARIRVVIRRTGGSAVNVLDNGVLQLDPANYHVKRLDTGETFFLSNREFAILQALMQYPGKIFSRSELEDKVYAWGEEPESNAVDYLIHALRKKLGHNCIKNVRGAGWLVSKREG
ncbi:response regulator transcription factor [Neisseria weaveri]|uniref:Protein BasR n=1 Tax=Neisseria weaveri TaxID=28091 RepID=A0A448VNX0_9NEIS|nr:response regulator transcription factor [Neisseria weaveri]EGV36880.1 DNA-binding response regulator [Neisseria weaveri ATCC 51223]EGV38959.1 DNA-binding response regulator [Neisseria weaveri LMG 5135]SAY52033.1 protein BasR [Neisseria weaveri]VEJ51453.1 protein BasR [Neisseria weaveri]